MPAGPYPTRSTSGRRARKRRNPPTASSVRPTRAGAPAAAEAIPGTARTAPPPARPRTRGCRCRRRDAGCTSRRCGGRRRRSRSPPSAADLWRMVTCGAWPAPRANPPGKISRSRAFTARAFATAAGSGSRSTSMAMRLMRLLEWVWQPPDARPLRSGTSSPGVYVTIVPAPHSSSTRNDRGPEDRGHRGPACVQPPRSYVSPSTSPGSSLAPRLERSE